MPDLNKRDTDLSHLHPVYRDRISAVLGQLTAEGVPFRIFEAYRSPQRQQWLFAQGRTRPGMKVTNARAWQSYHQYGVAADIVLYVNNQWSWDDSGPRREWWKRLHQVGRQNGLEPLSFETPHLQLSGVKQADLQRGRYPAGGDDSWAENMEAAIVSWEGAPASPPVPAEIPERPPMNEEAAVSVGLGDAPRPGSGDWRARFGGVEWRYDARGVYRRDHAGGARPLRTAGEPKTCRDIWRLCGEHIAAASRRYGVPAEIIVMTIATETAFARKFGFSGPHTFRWEPHVAVRDVDPPIVGDYSAGPMQTLATTARWVIREQNLEYDPFVVAPVYKIRPAPPDLHPLYDLRINIDIGTAEIKQRWHLTGDDPIQVAAAFNSGGLTESPFNRWHLSSFGDHLDRAAEWYGDACAVLSELR